VKVDGLICKIFIGDPPSKNSVVIHINGNTFDSNVNNLKWGTNAEKVQTDKKEFRSAEYINNITLFGEEWRDCSSYGYVDYLASSMGRIYSMKTGKVLSGYLRVEGYMQVSISVNNEYKDVFMHFMDFHPIQHIL